MNRQIFAVIEHPRVLFFFILLSFCLGIISGENNYIITFSWLIFLFILVFFSFKNFFKKFFIILCFFLIGFYLTNTSHNTRLAEYEKISEITNNFEDKITITGTIIKKMYQSDFRETYRLKIDNIDTTSTRYKFDSKAKTSIFVDIPKNLTLNSGDVISFDGKIQKNFENPEIWLKGFEKYSWLHQSYGKSSLYNFKKISQNSSALNNLEKNIFQKIFTWFPIENASLILGVTIGNTDLMTKNLKSDFKNSSLTHILVVSGANIAFVMLIIWFFVKYLPVHHSIQNIVIFGFVIFYGSLVGWDIPVIRASIMGIISYISLRSGQKINSLAILCLVAIILMIYEPLSLLYDASFALSFGATFGIIIFNPSIEKFLKKFLRYDIFVTSISVTLSATLGSVPALIYHFENFGFFGIFANILTGGIMGILLILSTFYIFWSLVFGEIFLYFIGIPIYYLTEYILAISEIFANFPPTKIPSNIKIPLCIFLCFIGFLYMIHTDEEKRLNFQKNDSHRL